MTKPISDTKLACLLVAFTLATAVRGVRRSEEVTCSFDLTQEPYNTGDTMMLCINYIPLMIKENAYLKVGRTAVLHQKYIWKIFQEINTDILMQVANSSIFTMSVPYNRFKNRLSFPFIPVVITLDHGKVIDMRVEEINDICYNDQVKTKLIKNFYATTQGEKEFKKDWNLCPKRFETNCQMGLCDPLVIVLWEGDDSEGNVLTSYFESFLSFIYANKKGIYEDLSNISYDGEYMKTIIDHLDIPSDILLRLSNYTKDKDTYRELEAI